MAFTPVTPVSVERSQPAASKADILILPVAKGTAKAELLNNGLPAEIATALADQLPGLGLTGAPEELVRIPSPSGVTAPFLALVGIGPLEADHTVPLETLRRAAGSAARQLRGVEHLAYAFSCSEAGQLAAIAEGAILGNYQYTPYKTEEQACSRPAERVTILTDINAETAKSTLHRVAVVTTAVIHTRDLVNQPASDLYPETFVQATKELLAKGKELSHNGKDLPIRLTVLTEKELEKEGYGGIMGVGKGSARPPRLVKLEYKPSRSPHHLAFVGKGVTFDTGGLCLKPASGMLTMKRDMAGAATVLTTTIAAAQLGLPLRLSTYLCLAENMPSHTATRPSDILTMHGGKTVEVNNTDAEGRLVMADALVAACAEYPDTVIDIATLTGAQVVALGKRYGGLMGDETVTRDLKDAADIAGELMWAMPIPEEMRASLTSTTADLLNTGERMGGMMSAAAFLREFIGTQKDSQERIPWGHIDIAGPADNGDAPWGYTPKDATGVAVRTLLALAERKAAPQRTS